MIQKQKKWKHFRLKSDKDIWEFGPFDGIYFAWNFLWEKFDLDISNLRSWKNCAWFFKSHVYVFEEKNQRLELVETLDISS